MLPLKKLGIILLVILFWAASFAQQAKPKKISLREDQLMLDFNWGTLLGTPDSVKVGAASWGFGMKMMLDNPVPKSKISFAAGVGLSTNTFYTNSKIYNYSDSAYSYFRPINDSIKYKRNKFTMTYVDIPVEIRFRSKPNEKGYRWKVAVGGEVSRLLGAKSKIIENSIKYKGFNYPNMEKWRVGLTARVGYGKVSVNAFYSLSSIFELNQGPHYSPLTVGFTLMPF